MDLVGRSPNGRLDSMSACMLLWSGSVSFDEDSIRWDGHRHEVGSPTIHDDVISLHALSHAAVASVMDDFLELVRRLGADAELSVAPEQLAEAVREALPTGRLTGVTLFLLQSGAHPLVIDSEDSSIIRVRYDEHLARGIPDLQGLLCRMACHLRTFRGDSGDFTLHLVENGARDASGCIRDFSGCVEGAMRRLEPSIEVSPESYDIPTPHDEDEQPDEHTDEATNPEIRLLQSACSLETNLYATRQLAVSAKARLDALEERRQKLEESKPDPSDKRFQAVSAESLGMPTGKRAAKSLAIRSAIYILIGALIFMAGRACFFERKAVATQLLNAADSMIGIVTDALNLATGQASLVGTREVLQMPMDVMDRAMAIIGIVLMTFGIIFAVVRILRHKRRLDHELRHTRSHVEFLTALAAKQGQSVGATYALALEGWEQGLANVTEDTILVKDSIRILEDAKATAEKGLKRCYATGVIPTNARDLAATCTMVDYVDAGVAHEITGADGAFERYQQDLVHNRVSPEPAQATTEQPTLRAAVRSARMLTKSVSGESSEERRHERIATHCEQVESLVAQASAISDALKGKTQVD